MMNAFHYKQEEKSSPISSEYRNQEPVSLSPSSSNKLPPINSNPGQHLSSFFHNSDDQLRRSSTSSGSISPSQGKQDFSLRKSSQVSAVQESSERPGNLGTKKPLSSVKLVSLSSEDLGTDNLIYLQVQSKEPDHTMLSLPQLSSKNSGQVLTHSPNNRLDKAEVSRKLNHFITNTLGRWDWASSIKAINK